MTVPAQQDPFSDPIIPPSTHPTVGSFRGRLIMITPRKSEMVRDTLNQGKMVERITADITVVDGLGPVPQVKGNPSQPTGQFLEGPDFTGVWIQSERIVQQISSFVGTGRAVLGVIDTRNPGTAPMKGNPWGITAATPDQKQQAVQFLASRTVGAAAAPAPAPQQAPFVQQQAPMVQQAPAPQPGTAFPAPAQAAPPVVAQPGPAATANPFLQQAPAAAPPAQPVNPFLQQAPQQ